MLGLRLTRRGLPALQQARALYGMGGAEGVMPAGSVVPGWHGTTILSVRKGGQVAMIGDGQVTMGSYVVKPNARKVRRITTSGEDVICGFAGSTADCFTLLERFERHLEECSGQLTRACTELTKAWRTEKYLRHLEALLVVANAENSYTLTGLGDVLEPHDGVVAIGSGGTYALAAARALIDTDMGAEDIARKAMGIAGELCVYTNTNWTTEVLEEAADPPGV